MKRIADPYRDLDVIDSQAPRFNQATVGALSATGSLSSARPWAGGRWRARGVRMFARVHTLAEHGRARPADSAS